MEAIFNSFFLVLASEMGDKTQLLALVLASRYRKPWAVMAGILVATLLNHGLASYVGVWLASLVSPQTLNYILAATFLGFAAWILIPDKDESFEQTNVYGAFLSTTIMFFLAEMGDKTQLATVALGASYSSLTLVTMGTTMGMLVADGVAVFFGEKLVTRVPMNIIRRIACAIFVLFGIGILFR